MLINSARDLSRQLVKSDSAVITVPEIELEIPAESQKGGEERSRNLVLFCL